MARDDVFCGSAGFIGSSEPNREFLLDGGDLRGVVCERAGLIGSLELNSELLLFPVDCVDGGITRETRGLIGKFD